MPKKPKAEPNYCYGCIHWLKYLDDEMRRCEITKFHIDERTINLCKLAGWRRLRWMHIGRDKFPHYPPAQ